MAINNLNKKHQTNEFDCGEELLNNYLKLQAKQDIKKKLAACFVLTDEENDPEKVIGYYTLSSSGIPSTEIPEKYKKHFPESYKTLPVTLLGRLAIDKEKQGLRLGEILLYDAIYRGLINITQVGSFALVVDPLNKEAIRFYEKYGFVQLDTGKMLLSWKTIEQTL